MDEVHVCVLRALCVDETPSERAEHALDMNLLDVHTWPPYVWEFLRITDDPLAGEEWAHRAPPKPEADDDEAGGGGRRKGGKKAGKKGGGAKAAAAAAAAAAPANSAADGAAPAGEPAARPRAFAPLSDEARAALDAVLSGTAGGGAAGAAPASAAAAWGSGEGAPRPPRPPPEYYGLPLALKASILAKLCDHLLDCRTIRAEVDRREASGQLVAGRGGAGGAFPIMTEEERKAAEEKVGGEASGGGRAGWVLAS